MTVKNLIEKCNFSVVNEGDFNIEIESFYCGDLLSWVMSKCNEKSCWLTIMTNINVAAVAQLKECSVVIICENLIPDSALISKAKLFKINILSSSLPVFETAASILK